MFASGLMLLDLTCLTGFGDVADWSEAANVSSSNMISGANAFLSLVQAMLLRLPGTDDGTLFPSNRRTFRSWYLLGEEMSWRGKVVDAFAPLESSVSKNAGLFSSDVSLEGVMLKRGILNGRTGEAIISGSNIEKLRHSWSNKVQQCMYGFMPTSDIKK